MIRHLIDAIKGKHPITARRSSRWRAVRAEHLRQHPTCAVCGGTDALEVHHKRPFHLHPDLELDPDNLVTLCESKKNGVNCHLWFGHLGSFRSYNVDVLLDAAHWLWKMTKRP